MGTLKAVANRSEAFLQNFQSLFPGGGDPDDRYAQFRLQPPQSFIRRRPTQLQI